MTDLTTESTVSIRVKYEPFTNGSKHQQVSIYAGPDAEHRAYCGSVIMREEEAEELKRRVKEGERDQIPILRCSRCNHPHDEEFDCIMDCATCVVLKEEAQLRHECFESGYLKDRDADLWVLDLTKGGWQLVLADAHLSDERVDFDKLLAQVAPLTPITRTQFNELVEVAKTMAGLNSREAADADQ